MCFHFSYDFDTFLILRIIQRETISVLRSFCNVPAVSVRFYSDLNILDRLSKNSQI